MKHNRMDTNVYSRSISICNCLMTLQNVNEVNREALSPQAASSVCDSTKHNGLVTTVIIGIQINSDFWVRGIQMFTVLYESYPSLRGIDTFIWLLIYNLKVKSPVTREFFSAQFLPLIFYHRMLYFAKILLDKQFL